jgi:hypothetical protein
MNLSAPHQLYAVRGQPKAQVRTEAIELDDLFEVQRHYSTQALGCILQLIQVMPALEALHLHWNNLHHGTYCAPSSGSSMAVGGQLSLQPTTQSSRTQDLKECDLRGIHVAGADLLQFLQAVRPATLTLRDVDLVSGTCTSIFEYLEADSPVRSYCVDDLRLEDAQFCYSYPRRCTKRAKASV